MKYLDLYLFSARQSLPVGVDSVWQFLIGRGESWKLFINYKLRRLWYVVYEICCLRFFLLVVPAARNLD